MLYVEKLTLKGYRCFENKVFSFVPGINVLVGGNAVGKTSTVEAVHYLSFIKSFRTGKDQELINYNANNFYIKAVFSNSDSLEVAYDGVHKWLTLNNVSVKGIAKILGRFNVVVFSPDDLNMIKLDPKLRRKFIDTTLCQVDSAYYEHLSKLKKIYKSKSAYLHKCDYNSIDKRYIDTLNSEFIDSSYYVIKKREEFIREFNDLFQSFITLIGDIDSFSLEYEKDTEKEKLGYKARDLYYADLKSKTTTWGPFRDDLKIMHNDSLAQSSASQGQIRSIAIAMKLAVVEYLKNHKKDVAVVLDDVLSELDKERQNNLIKMIKEDVQVFITSTDISLVNVELLKNCNIIKL